MLNPERLLLDANGAPMDRVVGFETEYGITCDFTRRANSYDGIHPSILLADPLGGLLQREGFQEDGYRTYLDHMHPEIATPETTSIEKAVSFLMNGHVRIVDMYKDLAENDELVKRFRLSADNVDVTGNAWGSHLNLLTRADVLPRHFIPGLALHNVSRIIYSGSGHVWRPEASSNAWRYVISQRAQHVWQLDSHETTFSRPIVNTREEPHADAFRYRRIHDIHMESGFSPKSKMITAAATSIVLSAIELGVDFSDLELADSVQAMKQISADPSLRREVLLADGRRMTALDLQWELYERSTKAAEAADYLTDQQRYWGEEWSQLLIALDDDPMKCGRVIDWVAKKKIVDRAVEQSKPTNRDQFEAAQTASVGYHFLYPVPGQGMNLLRRGFYDMSEEVMGNFDGTIPERDGRAKLRGETVAALNRMGLEFAVNWDFICPYDVGRRVKLYDPYASSDPRIEALLEDCKQFVEEPQYGIL